MTTSEDPIQPIPHQSLVTRMWYIGFRLHKLLVRRLDDDIRHVGARW